MNLQHIKNWLASFKETSKAMDFYADEFIFDDNPLEHHFRNDKAGLARAFSVFANDDPNNGIGIHDFEAVEYIGDENAGLALFKWKVTHGASFFGLPLKGGSAWTTGMSYHVYENGKIVRECVHSDQIHVIQRMGYPVEIPHYWEE